MEIDIYKRGSKPYPSWATSKPRRNPRKAPKGGNVAKPAKGSKRPSFVPKGVWAKAKTKTNKIPDAERPAVLAARRAVLALERKHKTAAKKPAAKRTAARKPAAKRGASKSVVARVAKLETSVHSLKTRVGKVEKTVSTARGALNRRLTAAREIAGIAAVSRPMYGPGRAEYEASRHASRGMRHGPGREELTAERNRIKGAKLAAAKAKKLAARASSVVSGIIARNRAAMPRTNPNRRRKGSRKGGRKAMRRGRR